MVPLPRVTDKAFEARIVNLRELYDVYAQRLLQGVQGALDGVIG